MTELRALFESKKAEYENSYPDGALKLELTARQRPRSPPLPTTAVEMKVTDTVMEMEETKDDVAATNVNSIQLTTSQPKSPQQKVAEIAEDLLAKCLTVGGEYDEGMSRIGNAYVGETRFDYKLRLKFYGLELIRTSMHTYLGKNQILGIGYKVYEEYTGKIPKEQISAFLVRLGTPPVLLQITANTDVEMVDTSSKNAANQHGA